MTIVLPHTFIPDTPAAAAQVMDNFNALKAAVELGGFGASNVLSTAVATEESRENTAYGTLGTPDAATILVPSGGLVAVAFEGLWSESVSGAAAAAIFINGTQLKVGVSPGSASAAERVQEAVTGKATVNQFNNLVSFPAGLASLSAGASNFPAPAATGRAVAAVVIGSASGYNLAYAVEGQEVVDSPFGGAAKSHLGGLCLISAVAGTYTIDVRYKASSGKVTAKNRQLWVWIP